MQEESKPTNVLIQREMKPPVFPPSCFPGDLLFLLRSSSVVLQLLKSKLPACQCACETCDASTAVIDLQYWSAITDPSIQSLHLLRYTYLNSSTPQRERACNEELP